VNASDITLWKDDGKIVAVTNPEDKNSYFIQIKSEYAYLESQILEQLEKKV